MLAQDPVMPPNRPSRRAALLAILAVSIALPSGCVRAPTRARDDGARAQARADLKRFSSQRKLTAGMVADGAALLEVLCDKEVEAARALALCERVVGDRPTRIHDALERARSLDLRGEALAAAVGASVDEPPRWR
jgi:hypothetical protein